MNNHDENIARLYRELGKFFSGVIPPRLTLSPSRDEVMEIFDEISLIASKIDPLIQALAEYAESCTGYVIDEEYKADQLRRQLDGNLLYEITCAADEAQEQLMEAI
jgi:hypothetical protein